MSQEACGPTPDLSIVLPCYNEQEVLQETHRRVKAVCGDLGCTYELVFVNDGSSDRTLEQLLALSRIDPTVVVVNLSRNHGHQRAILAGLHVAGGRRVAMLDADLQDPPELLADMLTLMDQGADVVYAQRRSRPGDAVVKRVACALFYRVLGVLSDGKVPLDSGDFRLLTRRVVGVLLQMPDRDPFIRGMVPWVGFKQVAYAYDRQGRFAGETKYPLSKLMRLALDGITSCSTKPLAIAGWCGLAVSGLAALLMLYAVWSWLFRGMTPTGWTSLMMVVTFLSGAQLMVLGVIGQYLARLYTQAQGRPLFVVDRIVRSAQSEIRTEERSAIDGSS
ncbi:MAG TPA: glycosyltransferase family 2 protein [Nitrospira sp.]|jgi:dolichol-phosphate mannosyltransferase|nr:glycosyltransferase family 2 protein [Nitrospira sp.]